MARPGACRRFGLPLSVIAALLLCCATSANAADPIEALRAFGLDPQEGAIDGRRAMAVLPGWYEEEGPIQRWLEPEGCTVHLVPWQDRRRGNEHPCGRWFLPPDSERYEIWVEGPGWMSPHPIRVFHVEGPFEGRGSIVASPVIPAGQVLFPELPEEPELWAWLLRAEADRRFEMLRLEPLRGESFAVQMPEGHVLAGLWDARRRQFLALSRPLEVAARGVVQAEFEMPRSKGHVLARLLLPRGADTEAGLETAAWLKSPSGDTRPPDLVVARNLTAYAVWYDVPPGEVSVLADGRLLALSATPVEVVAGEVTYLPAELKLKPRLDVEVRLPQAVSRERLTLSLYRPGGQEILGETTLHPDQLWARFEAMPLEQIQVELRTELGGFARLADLRDGADRLLVLEPELIFLHGTVYYGDRPHPARLELDTVASDQVTAVTDDEGNYEVGLLEPVRFIKVHLVDREVAPRVELYPRGINTSRQLDFHLSDVVLQVHVVDAVTREGLPGAAVAIKEAYGLEPDDGQDRGGQSVAQRLEADGSGTLLLPPPRQGRIEVYASAEGYERAVEPLTIEVTKLLGDSEYDIALMPQGVSETLEIRLPSGAPAVGAQVRVLDAGAGVRELLGVQADAGGQVRLPRSYEGRSVLVTHPQAAFLLRVWQPPSEGATTSWSLPSPAERALRLEVHDSRGEEPVRGARVALWIEGQMLDPKLLALISGSSPLTDALGVWTATQLPAGRVRAVAWVRPGLETGGFEALATEAAYPWPDPLRLRVIE